MPLEGIKSSLEIVTISVQKDRFYEDHQQ